MKKLIPLALILVLIFLAYLLPTPEEEYSPLNPSSIVGYAYLTSNEQLTIEVVWCLNDSEKVLIKFEDVKKELIPGDAELEVGEMYGELKLEPKGDLEGILLAIPENSKRTAQSKVNVKVEFGESYPLEITENATTSTALFVNGSYIIPYKVEIINPTNETIELKDVFFPVKGVKILSFGFYNGSIFEVPSEVTELPKTLPPNSKRTLVIYIEIGEEIDGLVFKPKVIIEAKGEKFPLSVPEMAFVRAICRKEKD
ncbi:hypothetical protein NF865_06120 [Thermococcus aggregans]|uniref:Uncharacterized protein n=1 Tax=Thermococcus aggregans TaxID=110163 RepID=A0A9E7MW88_THEAG|nr:hypothetical protein [Thermococcus aggregans]USS39937.1 hypothetical protein NF865_06120 [Thermococcus aggregans]